MSGLERSTMRVRWLVLVLACAMMIGNYYCYDNPSALITQLKTTMGEASFARDYNLLYTVYSIPNMALPFFGGYFVDKLGAPFCLIIFGSLILSGQVLFAFGTSCTSWPLMWCGRILFGLGGENLTVAQSALLAQWFRGKELALAFGINLSISRLGSVINNFISPAIAEGGGTAAALWFGVAVCGGSLVMAVLLWPIEKKAQRLIEKSSDEDLNASLLSNDGNSNMNPPQKVRSRSVDNLRAVSTERLSSAALSMSMTDEGDSDEEINLSDALNFGSMFWLLSLSCLVVYGCVLPFNNVAGGILLERNYFLDPPSTCVLTYNTSCTSGTLATDPNPMVPDTCPGKNHAPVLPSAIVDVTCDGDPKLDCDKSVYNFPSLSASDIDCNDDFWKVGCTSDYCDQQTEASKTASQIMSIPYILSAAISPFLGFAVDKVGYRAIIASMAPVILIVVHLTLAYTSGSPVAPLVGQGVAYSLFAAVLWPSVPFTVEEKSVGTAYGLITAIQNSGLAAFPLIISALYDEAGNKYIPTVEVFFAGCAALGVVVGVVLNVQDKRTGGKLNSVDGKGYEKLDGDIDAPPTPLLMT
ncbi:hypothetical protein TrCOL_g3605 [Triparma columacea]|uniref:Lysosomal dipeptide transporter MFSD1 n=1 Tax=Triparma columacea TaxID=722753 RepID=A0A9W7G121_9STRA|nr:hypothetical protein TrCOL_g3605 [Triparma columacea]